MCGRFTLLDKDLRLFEVSDSGVDPAIRPPRYNICPTQPITTVRLAKEGRGTAAMRWGFLPNWYETPNAGPLLINARSETLAKKPAFAAAARQRRCLIPASGFYEWRGPQKPKTPHYIASPFASIFAFAGVWQRWRSRDGEEIDTCAIVTCPANETLATIHHRMPVVIQPEHYGLWLGEKGKGAALLMQPAPDDFFSAHIVGPSVNSARSDGPSLLEPV